jgi:hypothetical protein
MPGGSDEHGGTVTDLAVALEQCAAALVPGPLLTTTLTGLLTSALPLGRELAEGKRTAGVSLEPSDVHVAADGTLTGVARPVLGAVPDGVVLLSSAAGDWFVVDIADSEVKLLELDAGDFSRPLGELHLDAATATALPELYVDRVRDLAATLAAAEASGIAAWSLRTAVDYAKVREQFSKPIGSFQAIKHLCAEMLCRAETAAAAAWDAAESVDDTAQHQVSAAVAAVVALDAAVENAKDCIQVLGGIGYTWEHDAHLYLRRALALRQWLGGTDGWRQRVASLTASGARRVLRVDLGSDDRRADIRRQAETIAAASSDEQRAMLAETGFLTPHWPAPNGLDATNVLIW